MNSRFFFFLMYKAPTTKIFSKQRHPNDDEHIYGPDVGFQVISQLGSGILREMTDFRFGARKV